MFNRLIFDSGKFDRETNSGYEGRLYSGGEVICSPTVITPLQNSLLMSVGGIDKLYPVYIVNADILIPDSIGQIRGANPEDSLGLILVLPLTITFTSSGEIDILNIGTEVVSVIDLRKINLLPNETITIDTDAMVVLFGNLHDVSSLTSNSSFFQLSDGINDLKFVIGYDSVPSPIPGNELETTIIWQNRWL